MNVELKTLYDIRSRLVNIGKNRIQLTLERQSPLVAPHHKQCNKVQTLKNQKQTNCRKCRQLNRPGQHEPFQLCLHLKRKVT